MDLEGNDIQVNDGNTFVNICPTSAKVIIEAPLEKEDIEQETSSNTNNI